MRCYHSGVSDDLAMVVDHVARMLPGMPIALVGFSLGGNVMLKFLGEDWPAHGVVRAGVGISVPCDLRSAALRIADAGFGWPMRWFLRDLGPKMEAKQARFGGAFPTADWSRMRSFAEFDDAFTAPIHGFRGAEDYWARCSSLRFLSTIRVPSLLLNALDDPMLSPGCFPFDIARNHPHLFLEAPRHGGHVAFASAPDAFGDCWSETRSLDFLDSCVPV
jgi:predicted alpha/beta-fold hydrolase